MGSQALLANFDTVAESPGGIDQLREVIFDLAVRGKLVPQDSTDAPAVELLDHIRADKADIQERGGSRPAKKPPPLAEPQPGLPPGWLWTQIDALGFVGPRNDADDRSIVGFVPMPLIPARLIEPHTSAQKPWGEIKKSYTHVADGDVAVAKITPCFENGKSTVFEALSGGIGAATTELHVLRPTLGGVLPHYVLLFLKSPQFRRRGEPLMTGTAGQKRLPRSYFSGAPFPLPPRREQLRIVAKVDELMQLCDELETRQTTRHSKPPLTCAPHPLTRSPRPGTPTNFKPHGPESTPTGRRSPITPTASEPCGTRSYTLPFVVDWLNAIRTGRLLRNSSRKQRSTETGYQRGGLCDGPST